MSFSSNHPVISRDHRCSTKSTRLLDSTISDTPLSKLLAPNGVFRPHPPTASLGLPLFSELWLRHPRVAGLSLTTGSFGRGTNLGTPVGVTSGSVIGSKLAQSPECKACGQGSLVWQSRSIALRSRSGELDGGNLEITKEGSVGSTVPDENKLNLSEDEAISAPMLTHSMVDGCKSTKVLNTLDVALNSHTSVEAIKTADYTNYTGGGLAAKHGSCSGRLAGSIGNEDEIVHTGSLGRHREVERVSG
ncbi:hypothetical protein HG530_006186 [Fusarium avenaceum]|nr:hypothetical protein HG530_006186 [Fusarium avenaceum]